jgi:sugar fermentation stimulation protein A
MPVNLARWSSPLIEARLVSRHQRFLALVELAGGERVVAHCVNPGRMEGLVIAGARVWLTQNDDPKRKLRYTLELVEREGRLVGANTNVPNRFVGELLAQRLMPAFADLTSFKAEVKYGEGHRVDFLLQFPEGPHFLEVKNCHLAHPDGRGYFPDSVSERASSHLETLQEQLASGARASVLFVVQDAIVTALRPSDTHDPVFAETARRVAKAGVAFHAVRAIPTLDGLLFDEEIPVDLTPYDTTPMQRWKTELDATSGWKRSAPVVTAAS